MSTMFVPDFLACSLDRITSMARGFGYVEDEGVKGVLRESLVESFLEPLLMPPYRAGTGVIIDCKGHQSGQCDIIIWDDSIFRPLYMARGAGIFFVEAVVGVLEIKSTVTRAAYKQAIQRAQQLKNMFILRPSTPEHPNDGWVNEPGIFPIMGMFGFRSDADVSERDRAQSVAEEEGLDLGQYLNLVVVPGKQSWSFSPLRSFEPDPQRPYHEVLMPIAGLVNTLKSVSEKRGKPNLGGHIVPYD